MEKMTGRERVEKALSHEAVDRVPRDFGGRVSGISVKLYDQMQKRMGINKPIEILDHRLMLAQVDEEILERLNIDTRYICQRSKASWNPQWNESKTRYIDEWGNIMGTPQGGYYFDYVGYPLADAKTVEDIQNHNWPIEDSSRNTGLLGKARMWRESCDPFILTSFKGTFEQAWALRGLENFLVDLYEDRELAEALLDRVLQAQKDYYGSFLEELSDYLGLVCFTDDVGGQLDLMISPQMYREILYPRHQEIIRFIREKAPNVLIGYHCCGSLIRILDDVVELGVDVLNPIQVTASGMNIQWLKDNYGDKLSFWGGIDTQMMLVNDTPEIVRETALKTCEILGKDGGYLFAPCHCIQAHTPIDNVMAMFEI